jgi:hypothetical protein
MSRAADAPPSPPEHAPEAPRELHATHEHAEPRLAPEPWSPPADHTPRAEPAERPAPPPVVATGGDSAPAAAGNDERSGS